MPPVVQVLNLWLQEVRPLKAIAKLVNLQECPRSGEYGLKNKHEVWRAKYTLVKICKAVRGLLTLEDKDPCHFFEGNALLHCLVHVGVTDP